MLPYLEEDIAPYHKQCNPVILTHAHLDHTGYLPVLMKQGFRGTVYCTSGPRDLCRILLPDSGRLQEEEAGYVNRKGFSKHRPKRFRFIHRKAQNVSCACSVPSKSVCAWLRQRSTGSQLRFDFDVTLDTHSVELKRSHLHEIAILRDDASREYSAEIVSSSGSGHHINAVLQFKEANISFAKFVELVIKGVAGHETGNGGYGQGEPRHSSTF